MMIKKGLAKLTNPFLCDFGDVTGTSPLSDIYRMTVLAVRP